MSASDEDDLLAGEYALGVLEEPARSAAEARLMTDPAFAKQVELWTARLSPMVAGTPEEPPASTWPRIASRLAANDDQATTRTAERLWRALAVGATAIAASLALVLVTRPDVESSEEAADRPVLVASLQDEETATAVTISVGSGTGLLLVTPVRLISNDHSPELWIIPGDGTPRSLGVIRAGAPSQVAVPQQHRAHIHNGATFAITLEPLGGSPTGAPTGQITASGKISRV